MSIRLSRCARRLVEMSGDVTIVPRVLSSASLKSDLIHPNEEGYRQIAQRVADLIRANER